jgi:hypothetical protein
VHGIITPVPEWLHCEHANSRGFGVSILRRPNQSTDREFRLGVNWCGEPLSPATRKAPVPTVGWLKSPGKPGWTDVQQASRGSPSEDSQVGATSSPVATGLPWLRFSVLFLSCKANATVQFKGGTARIPYHGKSSAELIPTHPTPQIADAFSQNDPNTSGFNSQKAIQPKSFWWRTSFLTGQSPTAATSLAWQVKAFCRDKTPLAQVHYPVTV